MVLYVVLAAWFDPSSGRASPIENASSSRFTFHATSSQQQTRYNLAQHCLRMQLLGVGAWRKHGVRRCWYAEKNIQPLGCFDTRGLPPDAIHGGTIRQRWSC